MRRDEFIAGLDRHGGDLAAWPDELRASAEELTARDAMAAAELLRMQTVERAVTEAVRPTPVDSVVVGRIVAAVTAGEPATTAGEIAVRPTRRLAAWAGAATVAWLAIGFAAGVAIPQDGGEETYAGLIFGGSSYTDTTDSGSVL